MRLMRFFTVMMLIGAIAACGFHLRGSYELPAHLSPIFVDKKSMSRGLFKELTSSLKASGAEVTEDSDSAASVVDVTYEQRTRDVISVDTLGRAREYRLIYRVTFSVNAEEEALIEGSKIELTRNLLFDPEQVLGVAEEEEIIYNDMIVDSARQIVQRMQALK